MGKGRGAGGGGVSGVIHGIDAANLLVVQAVVTRVSIGECGYFDTSADA